MAKITLKSSDSENFDTDLQIVNCSGLIKTMLKNCGMEGAENVVIPLANVNSAILEKVLQWANHHKNDPMPPTKDDNNDDMSADNVSSWDADFLKIEKEELCELVLAANYLEIENLMDLTCKAVANIIKGKSPEEIRKTFNLENDLPDEEENEEK